MPPGIIIPLQLNITQVNRQLQQVGRQIQQVQRQAGGFGGFGGGSGRPSPSFASRLQSAIYSTRFNVGGASPLVGRTLDVLGLKGNSAATAISALGVAAIKAANDLNAFRSAMFAGGGTTQETGVLGGFGRAVGMSAGDMAGIARQFAERITSDPMAMGLAARSGIRDLPGYFGKTDKVQNLIKWIDALAKMSDSEAIRAARVTGTEGLLPLRDLSPQMRQNILNDSKIRAESFTTGSFRDARDLAAAMGRLTDAFGNFVVGFAQPIIKVLTWFANKASDILNWFSGDPSKGGKGLFDTPQEQAAKERARKQEQHAKALDANTQAIEANTYAMKEGRFGGGERAAGAFPAKWTGFNAQGWAGQAAALGAFSL